MGLIETRTWHITCKRGFVKQCLGTVTMDTRSHDVTSTATAEKELRNQGWTLHEGEGHGTCPICIKLWNGELTLDARGSVRLPQHGGSQAATPLVSGEDERG